MQYFSDAPRRLSEAVDAWLEQSVAFVLNLGDIVDGRGDFERTRSDLAVVTAPLARLACPVLHVLGNHCLKYLPRDELLASFGMGPAAYYRTDLAPGWRLLVVDTSDISVYGRWADGSAQLAEAEAYLAAHPPGVRGAPDENVRMRRYNGGVGAAQLSWLRRELAAAAADGARVIVASHHCFAEGACRESHRAWNGTPLASLLAESGVVALALAGHDHPGGFGAVGSVPFVTVEAMLEAAEGSNSFGVVRVYAEKIEIDACGTGLSGRSLALPPWKPGLHGAPPIAPPLTAVLPSTRALSPAPGVEGKGRTLALWLLPDEAPAALLGVRMRHTASEHGLPGAAPHVTLLGDVGPLAREEAVGRLQQLRGGGELPISWSAIASEEAWNQCAAAVVAPSLGVLELHLRARRLFLPESVEPDGVASWAPPLRQPHLSLAYGLAPEHATTLELPPELMAGSVALVDCTPPTLEGVPSWREVARVSLRDDGWQPREQYSASTVLERGPAAFRKTK